MVTDAAGMARPDGSLTCPLNEAVAVWAHAGPAVTMKTSR
jgi:hypothetical protein